MTTTNTVSLVEVQWEPDAVDDLFAGGYVDVDEVRDTPVPHRYVHGGFAGTDTRFSLYFPPAEQYEGRFFQHTTPVPQSENLAQADLTEYNKIAFSVDSGAYFVETNGGGPTAADPMAGGDLSIGAYRASAASARFSRQVAARVYESATRPYGYLYGGSGGAYRTIGASENTTDVWDGFVPYVPGSPMAIPNVFSIRMHAQRVLRDVLPQIVDAYDVGGDPSDLDLTDEQRAALDEITRMGFPPRSWFGWRTMGMHAFSVLYPGVMLADPSYATEFWSAPGYLGADPTSSIHQDRIQLDTAIAELLNETTVAGENLAAGGVDESFLHTASGLVASRIRLVEAPAGWGLGAQLHVRSGKAAGSTLRISEIDGDVVHLEPGQDDIAAALEVGDEVTVDNSTFLAAQTYHRHQVPGPEYHVWDQFRGEYGDPVFPQRPFLVGPLFTQNASGAVPTGQISGKMIVVSCLLDREAFPWQADWYRARVSEHLGDAADDRFRLWFVDNALHGDDDPQEFPDHTVAYVGALETALRQLAAWVEQGVEPTPTSSYQLVDGQVTIPASVSERRGVQPVVQLTVNGASSTVVDVGVPVEVELTAVAPEGGVVVEVRPDFEASGVLGEVESIAPARTVSLNRVVAFDKPGVYFVSARVSAQSGGDATDTHARVQNVARARVTVS